MEIKLFPPLVKKIYEKEREKAVADQKQQNKNEVEKIKEASDRKIENLRGQKPKEPSMDGDDFRVMGLIIGFFVCSVVGPLTDEVTGSLGTSAVVAFLTWMLCGFLGEQMGRKIKHSAHKMWEIETERYDQLINSESCNCNKKIGEISNVYRENIEGINKAYKKMFDDYVKDFELTSQKESVKFVESESAKEIIEWMTEVFSKTIDSVDRSPHIEKICVPFIFSVYIDRITCNLGAYDFEIERCSKLASHIEQAALARAIASVLQLNIIMKYPQDESGTSISININHEYSAECPTVTVSYVAPNGNYKSVKEW